MVVSDKTTFSRRKFLSVGLMLTLIVLVITAVVIQIFEALEEDLYIHLFTVTHIFNGLAFTVLSVLHVIMNWKPMMAYIRGKDKIVSSEAIYAFLLTMIAILVSILFFYILMD